MDIGKITKRGSEIPHGRQNTSYQRHPPVTNQDCQSAAKYSFNGIDKKEN